MEIILVAAVNGIFAVLVVALGAKLNGKVNTIREQVKNDHPKNLRVEQDERHHETATKLNLLLSEMPRIRDSLSRVWQRMDKHSDDIQRNSQAIHDLEMTNPKQFTNARKVR